MNEIAQEAIDALNKVIKSASDLSIRSDYAERADLLDIWERAIYRRYLIKQDKWLHQEDNDL